MRVFLVGILLVLSVSIRAQNILVQADPEIEQLMQVWINQNRSQAVIDGWRLQLMSSTDRVQVESGRNQFLQLFPGVPAEWVHEKPYYKLRVGAFYTREEALAFLVQLKGYYSGAYPTRDPGIHPRDFVDF
ncbi:MAG: SPOR domain-containing protein [Saprospiraceae bacterium]|nr:SPOR domain-containing protein [Saprospiraceae bacterium]